MDNRQIAVFGGIALGIFLIFLFLVQSWGNSDPEDTLGLDIDLNQQANPTPNITQLQGQDIKVGSGAAEVAAGDSIIVHYVGSFLDGKVFDSSRERGQPLSIILGVEPRLIQGFEQGVLGMKVGGKRKLIIPPNLAYGLQGQGPVPPNTPIQFEVELLEIAQPSPTPTEEPEATPDPEPEPED